MVREQRKTDETAYRIVDAANPASAAVVLVADAPSTSRGFALLEMQYRARILA